MIAADERAAMVALLRTGRRPWVEYAELVEELGSPVAALGREQAAQLEPHGQTSLLPDSSAGDDAEERLRRAKADLERWDGQGMRLITLLDPDYPPNLKAVHDRPPILFIAGHLTPDDARSVAVVGTRNATEAGIDTARVIAEHLVASGYTVVSGLAAGIDTAAHTAALSQGGRTVAVIGTGLTRSYPPQNHGLQRLIGSRYAVISQFWPEAPPTRRTFPLRNAVMSGLTLATVVVEAPEISGARMAARLARAQGRPVFLLQDLVERQPWARRAATLPGTYVMSDPAEITAVLERLFSPGTLVA